MRDLFFVAVLPLMLYAMAKRPFVAVGMWIWTAMFFPNAWLYGFANAPRYNLIFTGIAILGYVVMKNKPKVNFGVIGALVLLFFLWTCGSSAMADGVPDITFEYWSRFMKVVLLFIFVILVIDKKLHVDFFLWCVVLSIGFYGCLEALKFVASGGGHHIEGFSGHVLGDRNELSLAFVMTLPICAYLLGEYGKNVKVVRFGLLCAMGLLVTAVVGTQSRGGFVALLGLAGYFFIKSERKVMLAILSVALVLVLSNFVSAEWTSRMDTISDANADASFMGRVVAWKLSFIMAMRHPFFGGGFKALEYLPVWTSLAQDFFAYPLFYTGEALPSMERAHAAHSVYFQVLGDHGFAGLAIYLAILARTFMTVRQVAKLARKQVETAWIAHLASMLQLAMFGYCLGGAALSFAYFELLYAICALVQVLHSRILPAELAKLAAAATTKAAPAVAREGALA